jgi:hypothetical protein
MGKCFIALSFATTSWSNNHKTVTDTSGIVKLDNFVFERLNRLQFIIFAAMLNCCHKFSVINLGSLGFWEKILNDILEQG